LQSVKDQEDTRAAVALSALARSQKTTRCTAHPTSLRPLTSKR